jgi:hypothetical protein
MGVAGGIEMTDRSKRIYSIARLTGLVLAIGSLPAGCGVLADHDEDQPHGTAPIREDHRGIADPHDRWRAYRLSDYVLSEEVVCFCPVQGPCRVYVQDGRVIDVIRQSDGSDVPEPQRGMHKTVEELFELIARAQADSVAISQVRYDPRFGYPAQLSIDWWPDAVDDEVRYEIRGVERLLW